MGFSVKFWGVRGSISCATPRHMAFGGNTSCLEVRAGDTCLILDSGTGIREFGQAALKEGFKQAYLLLTHTHWDHINGFPFFLPAFRPGYDLMIRAGHLAEQGGVRSVFEGQMMQPMFPVPLDAMRAQLEFADFRAGDSFELDDVAVRTAPLNHPGGATGYRLDFAGKSLCYITDTEHVPGKPDQNVLSLIEGADLVIYDCTYTDEEFPEKISWGHSTWQEGVRLCRAAKAKRLAIFHHDPDHDDEFMEKVEKEARETWSGAFAAREDMSVVLA
jgi:phosphoribosyl 1,2-cyclic phosphodiesterase